jgi:hypothetical protein
VNIPYYSEALSEASFVVHVCRVPSSYTYNFLILVSLLYALALVSYLLSPAELDPRVNLSLTVILGIVFFQIMLSDLLPTTGYLTDMHKFTFGSTLMVCLIAFSHVIIYSIFYRGEQKRIYLARRSLRYLREQVSVSAVKIAVDIPSSARKNATAVEVRRRKSAATTTVAHMAFSHARVRGPWWKQVLRCIKKIDYAIEAFCVFCLDRTNSLIAFLFAVGYAVMVTLVFKDATWHQGAHICK